MNGLGLLILAQAGIGPRLDGAPGVMSATAPGLPARHFRARIADRLMRALR